MLTCELPLVRAPSLILPHIYSVLGYGSFGIKWALSVESYTADLQTLHRIL